MRFITTGSKHPGVPAGPRSYVVRPTRRSVQEGLVQIRYGLRATFTNGVFDSVEAQVEFGWTDEDRELVEKHLLRHGDFGNGIYLHPNEREAIAARSDEGETEAVAPAMKDAPPRQALCIAEGSGDSPLCLQPCAPGSEFCPMHQEMYAPAVAELEEQQFTAPPMPVAAGE